MRVPPKDIKSLIIALVREKDTIDSVNLGKELRREFPDLNLKSFGGLNRFVTKYCAKEIESKPLGKHFIYSLRPDLNAEDVDNGLARSQDSVWKILSSPDGPSLLIINPVTGEVTIHQDSEVIPEGIRIQPLSAEDYRIMMLEFIARCEEATRVEVASLLGSDDFLHTVPEYFRNHPEQSNEWLDWRDQKTFEFLRGNLQDSGMSEDAIELSLDVFQKSKAESETPRFTTDQPREDDDYPSHRESGFHNIRYSGNNNSSLRRLIHNVVNRMDEEEMRRMWLPVGLVYDSLRRNFKK